MIIRLYVFNNILTVENDEGYSQKYYNSEEDAINEMVDLRMKLLELGVKVISKL